MPLDTEILVAGPGAAGLTAAIGLAQAGYKVVLAGPADTRPTTRTVALFEGSLRFLDALGMRETVEQAGEPLAVMRIADDTGSPFRRPPVSFRAREIGAQYFGYNVPNSVLVTLLMDKARSLGNIDIRPQMIARYDFAADHVVAQLEDDGAISARLLVAADGAASRARRAAGISTQTWDYHQTALTAFLAHPFGHENVSSEFHTRQGPCTFVPLPPQGEHRHCSSLVWLMSHREAERRLALPVEELEDEISQAGHYVLGQMKLIRPVNSYPMRGLAARRLAAPRIALIGEAAHVFPPIGAQGLNLGFRDVAHLVEVLAEDAPIVPEDPGAAEFVTAYASKRRLDIASRTFGVDLLNRTLLNHLPPIDLLRAIGTTALAGIGPLRRAIMQEGMSPQAGAPLVMRNSSRAPRDERQLA
ncbi:MAG: FAD-dependent monooxygenase [Hyphomicrobiales bacterium]|nr:FAD-dependent monooxygenase [Hyphomicrobiales bacterium]